MRPEYEAILQYMIRFPAILPADIAKRFEVNVQVVYNLRKNNRFQSVSPEKAKVSNYMTSSDMFYLMDVKRLAGAFIYGYQTKDPGISRLFGEGPDSE